MMFLRDKIDPNCGHFLLLFIFFFNKHFFKHSSDHWPEMTVDSTLWVSERPKATRHSAMKVVRAIRSQRDESRNVKMDLKSQRLLFSSALAFFCSSCCEGSTTDFTLCALSDLYSHFSQMPSDHHLVCEAKMGVEGGRVEGGGHLRNWERVLMLLKGRGEPSPSLFSSSPSLSPFSQSLSGYLGTR